MVISIINITIFIIPRYHFIFLTKSSEFLKGFCFPCLALLGDIVALLGAGLYITAELGITMSAYYDQVMRAVTINDLMQGLGKATLFGGLTALVGVVNGARVRGGAEGVGRVTTSAVVQSIAVIIFTDMVFTFVSTR